MFVIAENVFGCPVVQHRQSAPVPADIGEILQQSCLSGMAAKAAQPFLDGAALQKLINGYLPVNERRSTTRYACSR